MEDKEEINPEEMPELTANPDGIGNVELGRDDTVIPPECNIILL